MKWKRGRGGERDGERKENARGEERQRVGRGVVDGGAYVGG